jgi:hypothetical protein
MFRNLLVIAFIFIFSLLSVFSFSGNGSGTEGDPYQITNVNQLQEMNDELDAHYILMNDIDASETREWNVGDHDNNAATADVAMGFEPIGVYDKEDSSKSFIGVLFGNNYRITNLFINRISMDYVGLFSSISNRSIIKGINIENAEVSGNNYVGILAGIIFYNRQFSKTIIDSCNIHGNLTASNNFVGALAGKLYGFIGKLTIENIETNTRIHSNAASGGLIGFIESRDVDEAEIRNCKSTTSMICGSSSGGLIGNIDTDISKGSLIIEHCSAQINSESYTRYNNAGFIGEIIVGHRINFIIRECYTKGSVTGGYDCAGFIGEIIDAHNDMVIENCYSLTNVTCIYRPSGFIASNDNPVRELYINNCYSTGRIYETDQSSLSYAGFCGYASSNGTIKNCYWDIESSEAEKSDGGEGKTTEEMMMQSTFVDWDFDKVWFIGEHETYPQLQHFVDCDTIVSVPQSDLNSDLILYPNPVKDIVTLEYCVVTPGFVSISVYDINGVDQLIIPDKFHFEGDYSIDINTSDFMSGTYLIEIESASGISTKQVMVIK